MAVMDLLRRSGGLLGPMVLALLVTAACYRPTTVPADGASAANPVPFQASRDGDSESDASSDSGAGAANLPFRETEALPAGTLLSVRLVDPLSVEVPTAKEPFEAILDEPVVIDGSTLIPRGATVFGRVQAARVSKLKPDRGYVRLGLESIHIGKADVAIQTASLFARQTSSSPDVSPIRLEKGRRLTFRLTEEVPLMPPSTQARR